MFSCKRVRVTRQPLGPANRASLQMTHNTLCHSCVTRVSLMCHSYVTRVSLVRRHSPRMMGSVTPDSSSSQLKTDSTSSLRV